MTQDFNPFSTCLLMQIAYCIHSTKHFLNQIEKYPKLWGHGLEILRQTNEEKWEEHYDNMTSSFSHIKFRMIVYKLLQTYIASQNVLLIKVRKTFLTDVKSQEVH